MAEWNIKATYKMPLSDVLYGKYGKKEGQYVYMILFTGMVWYVGMTRQGVRWRLFEHIRQKSNIGKEMREYLFEETDGIKRFIWENWRLFDVKVLIIDGDLEVAEKTLIKTYQPVCNQVHCKECGVYLEEEIDREVSEWEDCRRLAKVGL